MTEPKIPAIKGLPALDKIEGFQSEFQRCYFNLRSKTALNPNFRGEAHLDPREIDYLREQAGLIEETLRTLWGNWLTSRESQPFHARPPELRPDAAIIDRLAKHAASLAIKFELIDHIEKLEASRIERVERQVTHRRRGSCQLRGGKVWKCDGRLVLDGDGPEARFEDDGQLLTEYLQEVRLEQAEARERHRRERREAYARRGISVKD